MKLKTKTLQWQQRDKDYYGTPCNQWSGTCKGHEQRICLTLTEIKPGTETYRISTGLDGMAHIQVGGLERAKAKAQEIFDSYAYSLFDLVCQDEKFKNTHVQ